MIWSLLGSLFGGLWKLAKLVPWYVWIAAVVAGYGWHWHTGKVSEAYASGVQDERAKWQKAEADAVARQERETKAQQERIDKDAAESKAAADKRLAEQTAKTQSLREQLRHANQPKPGTPIGCPDPGRLSDERRDLLNKAIGYD